MGEVYRAHDARLGRDVAIKVLPASMAADPDAMARFAREARAVAALSHPNILSIYDVGIDDGLAYAVMELLEGETLRARLDASALSTRKAVELAVQIAQGLAAAHDKGVVHRDLKPENVFITRDGRVKILDFGLARIVTVAPAGDTHTQLQTGDGVVLGTVGYMSPEQVRGLPADHRSDIFSCGVVLYEMLAGRRPFGRDSAVETMNAILKEQPAPVTVQDEAIAPAIRRITEHCLEKQPEERFQSARDLAFDLESLRTASDLGSRTRSTAHGPRRMPPLAAAAVAAAALAAGLLAGRYLWAGSPATSEAPSFRRLTHEKGTIWNARFAPDGQVVYGAAWDGGAIRAYLSRADRPGSTSLNLPDAAVLAISSTGELAVSLDHAFEGWMGSGTLARVQLFGSGPRPVAEHVREADWTPDGRDLAIVRRVNGRERLELPIGTPLYETSGYISHIRVSKDGQRIAFADHPLYADDNGDVALVDRNGTKTTLAQGLQSLRGLAWSPDGREVWFTAINTPGYGAAMRAVSLDGRSRTMMAFPTDWRLQDIAGDGRLLITGETVARHVELRRDGQPQVQELAGSFEQALATSMSRDGRAVLITEQGGFAGPNYATHLREVEKPAAVRLGEGQALGFSPDGRSVLSVVYGPPSRLLLLPTGVGDVRELPNPDKLTISVAAFLPDGRRVALLASLGTAALKGYIQDIASGAMQPFTGEGVNAAAFSSLPIVPDGSAAWLNGPDGEPRLYPLSGGEPRPLPGVLATDNLVMWSADGRQIYVSSPPRETQQIHRVDIATGTRTVWREIVPSQPAGLRLSQVLTTEDGRTILHSYSQLLSTLFVLEGASLRR